VNEAFADRARPIQVGITFHCLAVVGNGFAWAVKKLFIIH
jgi:hypothetical protein